MHALCEVGDMSFLWTERKHRFIEEELKDVLISEGLSHEHPSDEIINRRRTATERELKNLIPSSDILAEKKQLDAIVMGDKPVFVIKGDAPGEHRKILDRATTAGKGT